MGLADKIGATTDRAAGAAKAKLGAATGNADLQTHGEAQNAVGHAKQTDGASQPVEDTARDIADRPDQQ